MRTATAALLLTLVAAAPAAANGGGSAALDYTRRCRGCHGLRGEGAPGHVPRLAGFVGLYTRVPGGRNYLVRVPGVARSGLDDARLAAVLNWMLAGLSPAETAPGFAPFTAEEVGAARREPLAGRPERRRAGLLAALRERGLLGEGEDGLGVSAERGAEGP